MGTDLQLLRWIKYLKQKTKTSNGRKRNDVGSKVSVRFAVSRPHVFAFIFGIFLTRYFLKACESSN